jgi:hypothetical protein
MLKLSIYCTRFKSNDSSCTGRRVKIYVEKIYVESSGGAQEKGKTG